VIDEATNKCVYYEEMRPYGENKIQLPPDLLKNHPQLRIRTDLIDCHVDICSPDVPALFTENFDYQHIRRHFLHGILTDFDLYGKAVHTHVVTDHYAARVRSFQTYDSVSRDIITRWTIPMVPDSNLNESSSYTLERGNIYKEDGVYLARSALVKPHSVLGSGTSIGANSTVTACVLGRNVRIGANVVLNRVYVWDNAVIDDGCSIIKSIIANNAHIGANTVIESGSVISFDVAVPAGSTIRGFSKISNYDRKQAAAAAATKSPDLSEDTGAMSGEEYEPSNSESESEQYLAAQDGFDRVNLGTLSDASSISTFSDSDSDSDSESSTSSSPTTRKIRSDSMASATSDDASWHKEASSSLLNAMEANHPVEIASLELNGLRMTANANWHQVRRAIMSAIISRIEQLISSGQAIGKATEQVLTAWKALIKRAVHEKVDQVDLLHIVQRECASRPKDTGASLLLNIVQRLYDPLDLVEEEAILAWWNKEAGEKEAAVREKVQKFVEWLKEADEEDSEEGESGEEESEEEEEESDDE
jgi:translation initiation factor eIF-2B subunit epsilon